MQTWKWRKPVCFVSMAVIGWLFYWGGTLTVGRATIVSMVNARTPPLMCFRNMNSWCHIRFHLVDVESIGKTIYPFYAHFLSLTLRRTQKPFGVMTYICDHSSNCLHLLSIVLEIVNRNTRLIMDIVGGVPELSFYLYWFAHTWALHQGVRIWKFW